MFTLFLISSCFMMTEGTYIEYKKSASRNMCMEADVNKTITHDVSFNRGEFDFETDTYVKGEHVVCNKEVSLFCNIEKDGGAGKCGQGLCVPAEDAAALVEVDFGEVHPNQTVCWNICNKDHSVSEYMAAMLAWNAKEAAAWANYNNITQCHTNCQTGKVWADEEVLYKSNAKKMFALCGNVETEDAVGVDAVGGTSDPVASPPDADDHDGHDHDDKAGEEGSSPSPSPEKEPEADAAGDASADSAWKPGNAQSFAAIMVAFIVTFLDF